MAIQKDIVDLFQQTGWAQYPCWVYYTAITKALNNEYMEEGKPMKKGSTIERVVRMLVGEGKLEADRRGNFRWRQN